MKDFLKWMWEKEQDVVITTSLLVLLVTIVSLVVFYPALLLTLLLAFMALAVVGITVSVVTMVINGWVKGYKKYKKGRTG